MPAESVPPVAEKPVVAIEKENDAVCTTLPNPHAKFVAKYQRQRSGQVRVVERLHVPELIHQRSVPVQDGGAAVEELLKQPRRQERVGKVSGGIDEIE